ncbi:MAG: hypothetical protein H5T95_11200 [Firmicutes bacterium]|nr:hypothetical protein [Bacillota bacterium]
MTVATNRLTADMPFDLAGKFLELEREFGLFDLNIDGTPVWWFMRTRAFSLLHRKLSGMNLRANADSLGLLGSIRIGLRSLPYVLRRKETRTDILAVSTASARRHITEDGLAFDVFFDFLSYMPGVDYAVLEFPDRGPHSVRPYSRKVLYGDGMSLAGNVHRLASRFQPLGKVALEISERLVGVSQALGIAVDPREARKLVAREIAFSGTLVRLARRLLDHANPRVLIVESASDPSHMAVQFAAKERGVPVVEMQHGLISVDSPAFFFDLPRGIAARRIPFPDVMLVFGEYFKRVLTLRPSVSSERVIPVGYPYLWLEYQRWQQKQSVSGARGDAILITSQPGLGAFWSEFAVQLSRLVKQPIIIKPHPAEADKVQTVFGTAMKCGRVEVIKDSRSLYDLFPLACYHLSVSSTSHLEAIAFGLKDIIVTMRGIEKYVDFLRDRGLPTASTPEDVADLVASYPDISSIVRFVREEVFCLHKNPIHEVAEVLRSLET